MNEEEFESGANPSGVRLPAAGETNRPTVPIPRSGFPSLGDRFVIAGGDGDQDFLNEPQTLVLTTAEWFPDFTCMSGKGPAMLFKIDGGRWSGRYLALSSRVQASLVSQFATHGLASTVVQLILDPDASFDPSSGRSIDALAMAVVYRI